MRCNGRMEKISLNMGTGRREITLAVDAPADRLERYQGKELAIEIKQFRNKRSLEANAYYWKLVSQISEKCGESAPWIHNQALRECAYLETVDGLAIYVKVPEEDEKKVDEDMKVHLMPTDEIEDGERIYLMLRGSRTFNTIEMSHLINTAIAWAKEWGIDPDTPDELARMVSFYG